MTRGGAKFCGSDFDAGAVGAGCTWGGAAVFGAAGESFNPEPTRFGGGTASAGKVVP